MWIFRSPFSDSHDPRRSGVGDHSSDLLGEKGSRDVSADRTAIDLYWLPLGAGGRSVRLNGRVFEACAAALGRVDRVRPLPLGARGSRAGGPVRDRDGADPGDDGAGRGVVAEGAVGAGVGGTLPALPLRGAPLARRRHPGRRRGRREPAPAQRRSRLRAAAPRAGAARADAGVGPRRAAAPARCGTPTR